MTEVVLDASAVIALINKEPGADVVDAVLDEAVISAVNLSEVIAVLTDAGFEFDEPLRPVETKNAAERRHVDQQGTRAELLAAH